MRRWKKIVLSSVGVLVAAGGLLLAANWNDVYHFPSIISSYYAKEMCSCLYVTGQPEQFCHDYVRQYIAIDKCEIDSSSKAVTVTGLWRTNRAHFVDDRFGCVLDPP